MDTLLDTLEEGRHSFLEISIFPELLKSSNPPLSAILNAEVLDFGVFSCSSDALKVSFTVSKFNNVG